MDIKTETFGTLTSKAFDASCKYLKSVTKRVTAEWRETIIFGVAAVFATGDATHVNKLLPILVALGLGPMFERVIVKNDVVPFKYNGKSHQYTGKIDIGRRAALEMIVDGVPQWETLLNAALNGELAPKEPAAFKLNTRMSGLIKKDRQQEVSHSDGEILKMVRELLKEFPQVAPESTMVTAKDQQRIVDNKVHLAEKVAKAKATNGAAAH